MGYTIYKKRQTAIQIMKSKINNIRWKKGMESGFFSEKILSGLSVASLFIYKKQKNKKTNEITWPEKPRWLVKSYQILRIYLKIKHSPREKQVRDLWSFSDWLNFLHNAWQVNLAGKTRHSTCFYVTLVDKTFQMNKQNQQAYKD